MTKEEILQKSRLENKNGDEREQKAREKGLALSASVGALVCMILVIAEEHFLGHDSSPLWIIYGSMVFTGLLVQGVMTKKKHQIVLAVVTGIAVAGMIFMYIKNNFC